ncbi:MAG: DNA polymerase Y family protein, partial [Myxococcota bacterium]
MAAVAEVASHWGTTVALALEDATRSDATRAPEPWRKQIDEEACYRYPAGFEAGPLDTVWLDISGCARRVGGEDVLAHELWQALRTLGHQSRIAIARD